MILWLCMKNGAAYEKRLTARKKDQQPPNCRLPRFGGCWVKVPCWVIQSALFPLEGETIFLYAAFRDALGEKYGGILLFFDLLKGGLHRAFQAFFAIFLQYLKLQ